MQFNLKFFYSIAILDLIKQFFPKIYKSISKKIELIHKLNL